MRIYVNEIKITEDSINCYTEQSTEGLQEAGQMLVDSDNHAFAHILDNGESYTYLIFVQETWSMLHENKGKKIIVFKYKPKKDYRRKNGHRQPYTKVKIEKIEA